MSQFEFNLATQEDDAALRELLAATPMHGDIELAFAREPSYFAASAIDGPFTQVVAARNRKSKRIIGIGTRSISSCYVNGKVVNVGYLSSLRLVPEFRGKAAILARGYRFFRELHQDNRTTFYITSIASDNAPAISLLTSQRAGLPIYHPLGKYHTLTLSSTTRCRRRLHEGVTVRTSTPEDGQEILNFLNREGSKRQFFPSYKACEFFESPHQLLGLQPESVLLAYRRDTLVGTLGIWDQRSFKQNTVSGYSSRLRMARPFYNAVAALRGRPKLPIVGEALNLRYAAIPVVAGNDPKVAENLIQTAIMRVREQRGDFLALGLHESEELLPLIRHYSGREYVTLIYVVYWPGEDPDIEILTDRVPYLELGCL